MLNNSDKEKTGFSKPRPFRVDPEILQKIKTDQTIASSKVSFAVNKVLLSTCFFVDI